jgi:hypothetical protein
MPGGLKVIGWIRRTKGFRAYMFLRIGIVAALVIQMIFGLTCFMTLRGMDYGTPFLTVSPWQPLWTMGLPALWILVLFSPRMNRFCRRPAEISVRFAEPCAPLI